MGKEALAFVHTLEQRLRKALIFALEAWQCLWNSCHLSRINPPSFPIYCVDVQLSDLTIPSKGKWSCLLPASRLAKPTGRGDSPQLQGCLAGSRFSALHAPSGKIQRFFSLLLQKQPEV